MSKKRPEKDALSLRSAYREVFTDSEFSAKVFKDLENYCGVHRSNFETEPTKHAFREGRRDVYLRIREFLDLDEKEFLELKRRRDVRGN